MNRCHHGICVHRTRSLRFLYRLPSVKISLIGERDFTVTEAYRHIAVQSLCTLEQPKTNSASPSVAVCFFLSRNFSNKEVVSGLYFYWKSRFWAPKQRKMVRMSNSSLNLFLELGSTSFFVWQHAITLSDIVLTARELHDPSLLTVHACSSVISPPLFLGFLISLFRWQTSQISLA